MTLVSLFEWCIVEVFGPASGVVFLGRHLLSGFNFELLIAVEVRLLTSALALDTFSVEQPIPVAHLEQV